MDRRAGGAGAVAIALLAAVAVFVRGVPPFDPAAPEWWLLVAVGLLYWLGMIHWTGGE